MRDTPANPRRIDVLRRLPWHTTFDILIAVILIAVIAVSLIL
jgi:hypothetical protein